MRANKKNNAQRVKNWFLTRRPQSRFIFIIIGILSTLWFLIRVIPRPGRAAYPCMQAAAPFAAAFLAYITGLLASAFAYRRLLSPAHERKPFSLVMAVLLFCAGALLIAGGDSRPGRAEVAGLKIFEPPNSPVGTARGIFPGRVVWVWNPMATDETCTNTEGDYWFQDDNADAPVIEDMLSNALQLLTGEESDSLAWDALFRHFNETHGNGNVGYQPGQKIAIKINLTTGGWGNIDLSTYNKINYLEKMDATPQLVVAMLKQLIGIFGVAEADIAIGDPIRNFYNQYWDRCHSLYPDVKYLDWHGFLGRTAVVTTPGPVLYYSDGTLSDSLPTAFTEADYMINMGCLKQHDLAGGTFCAKNHFGSICRDWAMHLHYALPSPTSNGFENLGYGKFRNLVDLMGHKDLGGKTVLFLVDGIWGGELPVSEPVKWWIEPFNNDWPNSLFVSQDHVAIESVGMDFVRAQFDEYADMLGADDYLHQAADSANWPDGVVYDPEGDGIIIESLGVHEHWNNDVDKEYTRNLGTGDGIELLKYLITGIDERQGPAPSEALAYPNPFSNTLTIEWKTGSDDQSVLEIFDAGGRLLLQTENFYVRAGAHTFRWDASGCGSGIFFYNIRIIGASGEKLLHGKIIRM